jgi:hypothetical protein
VVTPLVILFIVFKTKTKLFALAENSEITANGDNTQAPWQQPDHQSAAAARDARFACKLWTSGIQPTFRSTSSFSGRTMPNRPKRPRHLAELAKRMIEPLSGTGASGMPLRWFGQV